MKNKLLRNIYYKFNDYKKFHFDTIGKKLVSNDIETKKTIIVLSMHRTASSLVAKILKDLDVNIGIDLLEADNGNPKGYYENKVFIEMNDKILYLAGGSWDKIPTKKRLNKLLKKGKLQDEIKHIINSQKDKIWGWKDPRTVLTIDFYKDYLVNPRYIIIERAFNDIANSLYKRNKMPLVYGLELAEEYGKRLKEFLNKTDYPTLFLDFKELVSDVEKAKNRIKEFVGQ